MYSRDPNAPMHVVLNDPPADRYGSECADRSYDHLRAMQYKGMNESDQVLADQYVACYRTPYKEDEQTGPRLERNLRD